MSHNLLSSIFFSKYNNIFKCFSSILHFHVKLNIKTQPPPTLRPNNVRGGSLATFNPNGTDVGDCIPHIDHFIKNMINYPLLFVNVRLWMLYFNFMFVDHFKLDL